MGSKSTIPRFDEHIARAVGWFYETWLDNPTGSGWSHYAGNPRVTQWGGTLDGVRALLYAGESRFNPKIAKSIEWLKSGQLEDGSWLSWEIRQSCVEVTGWMLITLRQAGEGPASGSVGNGAQFLVDAQHSDGSWGAYKGAPSRVYPTLISVWALSRIDDAAAARGARWLEAGINSDGGWGFKHKDELSNIAMTAMVPYSLLTAGHIDPTLKQKAIDWIRAHREPNGLWEPVFEDWINYEDPETGEQFPTRTNHFSSGWVIMALIKAGESVLEPVLLDAVTTLASLQERDGSWAFVPYDPNRHTWCVANALWALADARNAMFSPMTHYQSMLDQTAQIDRMRYRTRWIAILSAINLIAIIGVILYVTGAFQILAPIISNAAKWVVAMAASHSTEFLVATISAIVAGYVLYRVTKGRAQ